MGFHRISYENPYKLMKTNENPCKPMKKGVQGTSVARRVASNVVARPGPSFNCVFLRMDGPWTPVFMGFHEFVRVFIGNPIETHENVRKLPTLFS